MTGTNLFLGHYLQDETLESSEVITSTNLKWECLGAACPSSCCRFSYARVSISEIVPLSKYFPIVFCADSGQEGMGIDVCILMKMVQDRGNCTYLQAGVGCMLKEERPLACKQYPFWVGNDDSGKNNIHTRPGCYGFSELSGYPVLAPDKKVSAYLEQECIIPSLIKYESLEDTRKFVEALRDNNLIVGGQYSHHGVLIQFNYVDAKRIYALSGETLNEFRMKGYMDLLFAHMNTLAGNCAKIIDVYVKRQADASQRHIMHLPQQQQKQKVA